MEGQTEQQRIQGVALLYTFSRKNELVTPLKMGGGGVGGVDKRENVRSKIMSGLQHFIPMVELKALVKSSFTTA